MKLTPLHLLAFYLGESLRARIESGDERRHPDKALRRATDSGRIRALKSNGMSQQAEKYFDCYFESKRDAPSPKKSAAKSPRDPALFEQRDKDQNGEVTWAELLSGRTGDKVPDIRRHFERRNTNHNGVWEKSEITP